MKRNIHFAFFLLLLCASFTAKSQTQRTVEVIISDTLNLKATSFEYKISAGNEDMGMFGALASAMGKDGGDQGKNDLLIDSVEQLLKANHYNFTMNAENKYALGHSGKPSAVIVKLSSEAELEGLCKKLTKLHGLNGTVQNVNYEKPDQYLSGMFARLYSSATREAGEWAKNSGGSLGKVLNITEIKSMSDAPGPYESMMSEMMKKPPFSAIYESSVGFTKTYSRKMSFRFELN